MGQINLVIFDCDGVLVDSEIIAAGVVAKAYKPLGFEIEVDDFIERFAGMTGREIKLAIEDELGFEIPDTILDETEEQIDEALRDKTAMVVGADKLIDAVSKTKCICSNSATNRLNITLSKTGLLERIGENIHSAQSIDGIAPKPAPDIFLYAMQFHGAEPRETIVLEDSTHGVKGAIAAGARVVGFTGASHSWPSHADALVEAGAETVISRLSDFPATLAAMEEWEGLV